MTAKHTHILIINQHGDNRGDEAAMRAMVEGFQNRIGDVQFTILHQFADRELRPQLEAKVDWNSLILSPIQGLALLAAAIVRPFGIGSRTNSSSAVARIRNAYETADLVVNAPGGPYFGDIYANHEIIHWFYVWIAKRYGKPVFHYATSVGPFENRLLNPLRKWLFRRIDRICVREEVSAVMLRELLPDISFDVTADSAIQRKLPTKEEVVGRYESKTGEILLGASARMHKFPDAANAAQRTRLQNAYLEVLETAIRHAVTRGVTKVILFPQLYGAEHSDVPFLNEIGNRIGHLVAWEIFDPEANSDQQRDAIQKCDLFVASRYHPQIFAACGGVPGICFTYEHKMVGFMQQLGMERFAFPIDRLDADKVIAALDEIFDNRRNLGLDFLDCARSLREISGRTTDLAVDLLKSASGPVS